MQKTELSPESNLWEQNLRWVPAIFILIGFGIAGYYYPKLPERIPIHFGINGEADGWGEPITIFLLPGINFAIYLILELITRYTPPSTWNYPVKITEENKQIQYLLARRLLVTINLVITAGFTFLTWVIARSAIAGVSNLGAGFLLVFLAALFGAIIYYMVQANKYK